MSGDMIQSEQKVGVIIPVYNRPKLVIDTLNSVAKQTVHPEQVIVIDDGSTDDTARVVEAWIQNLDIPLNVKLVSTENGGASVARNHGLALLKDYEFIAFLDSDEMWPEAYIEIMMPVLRKNKRAVAVSCDKIAISEGNEDTFIPLGQLIYDTTSYMLKKTPGLLSNSIFRGKYIFEVGLFDETLKTGEDAALCLPLSLLGPWLHQPHGKVISRLHNNPDEESNKHCNIPGAMMIWGGIYDSFVCQIDAEHPKLRKWKLNLSALWFAFGFAEFKKFSFANSLYCFSRVVFWVFSSLKH